MSRTLDFVKELEEGPGVVARLPQVRQMATEEAEELLWRLGEVVRVSGKASGIGSLLLSHLDKGGLGASIYRHALLHAGLIIEKATNRPFGRCPKCGEEL